MSLFFPFESSRMIFIAKGKEEGAKLKMIDHIFSFFVSNNKAIIVTFIIIWLAFIYPGVFKFLYVEGRDFGRSLVNSILS